jgi:hypothetical protein
MTDDQWDNERFEGPYARDRHRGGYGDNYARDSFRGSGPKNYRRGDERIRDDVNDRPTDGEDVNAENEKASE